MTIGIDISTGIQNWLRSFKEINGRPLSVLHIGNIANNAYINAKLLKRAGLDCDVICHGYYHMMACPEWEDADFEGVIKDHFFPDWRAVRLNGFRRPAWFVQGPTKFSINYLIAKRGERKTWSWFWWNILKISRKIVTLRNSSYPLGRALFHIFARFKNTFPRRILPLLSHIIKSAQTHTKRELRSPKATQESCPQNEYFFGRQVNQLLDKWIKAFPDRDDKFSHSDVESYGSEITLWRSLCSKYDIIQGYSTDPILPLLAGIPYFAFEHGTLRDIPFQHTTQGRLTALSYSSAEHIFVTNADCIENAHKLAGDRVSFINHPFDENHGLKVTGWEQLRQRLRDLLDADFLFFFPTRHDWVPGTGYGDKGNDVFLQAFCRLREGGYRVGMVCCRWGANVKESMNLLKKNNCHHYVLWSEPMGTVKFERTSKACDMIIDQFKLGSFGGITFKAMAVGAPICTYLDEDKIGGLYNEIPPVINCKTEEEVLIKIKDILKDPIKLNNLREASRKWIKKYHNSKDTIEIQVSNYIKFMETK